MGALFVFSIPSPGAKSPSRILSKLQRLHATQSQCGTERWMPDKSNEESSPKDFLKAFARTNADFFDIFQKNSNILLKAKQTQSMYKDPGSIYVASAKLCGLFFNSRDAYWTEPKSIPREIETICRKLKKFPLAKPFVPQ